MNIPVTNASMVTDPVSADRSHAMPGAERFRVPGSGFKGLCSHAMPDHTGVPVLVVPTKQEKQAHNPTASLYREADWPVRAQWPG
ncbi:MAG: hypothetical protein JXR52_05340 [Bacteroidales bacterium]|nr:hypothetical protein [Bacteroidales bacterium]